jgi:putative phosphoribosyl transferase
MNVFANGIASNRKSPRNRRVAEALRRHGFATLLLDLLTADESEVDAIDSRFCLDISLLARRLGGATDDFSHHAALRDLPVGYFGASTGAAAALIAAAERPSVVRAIVSRGGRPDLARAALPGVLAPTLLIVGSADTTVARSNQAALAQLPRGELAVIAGATHLFEEPGALDQVERLAADWFSKYLAAPRRGAGGTRTIGLGRN